MTRSGGFAGLTTPLGAVDTSELPEAEARALEELAEKANLEELARRSPIRGGGADRYQYDLIVEDSGGRHEVAVSEDQVPNELRPLIERVQQSRRGDSNP